MPWAHPSYWCYVYEEGNESIGTYNNMDEELIITRTSYDITKENIEKFKKYYPYDAINQILINENPNQMGRRIMRALEWFSSGFSESNYSHKFIQYCVAIESLIGQKELFSPITIELAERIAFLSSRDVITRMKIKSEFRDKVFKLRGKILHSGYSLKDEDLSLLHQLERAMVATILQVLRNFEHIGNDRELGLFFDRERFYPQPLPEDIKKLEEIRRTLESIQKKN